MMRNSTKPWRKQVAALLLMGFLSSPGLAATLEELRNDPRLTPQRFARHFSDFEFEYRDEVQPPEIFLMARSGDCDDYATLAAQVLGEKGYTVRLIAVRMPVATHVVAYVVETGSYLDYNNREYLVKTTASDGSLEDIARRVARSFETEWTSVSEFTFEAGAKRLGATVVAKGVDTRRGRNG